MKTTIPNIDYLWVSIEELTARCKTQEEYDQTIYMLNELLGE